MKFVFIALILIGLLVIFGLVINTKEALIYKPGTSFVKFNIKDLPEHRVTLIAPSDPAFTKGKNVTVNPYSILLRNASSRPIVGYSIKWECFDGQTESASRDMSNDLRASNILGVVLTCGEESERQATLSRLERDIIKPYSTWIISDVAAGPIGAVVEEVGTDLEEAALAEVQAACPIMTVTLDGVFFDDGTFIGPDTTNFFVKVKTQMDARHELLAAVDNELKTGKNPTEVFRGLEQIRDREGQPQGGEMTIQEHRSYFRKKYAQDVLGKKEMWGINKALEDVQRLLSRPWVKLRKI